MLTFIKDTQSYKNCFPRSSHIVFSLRQSQTQKTCARQLKYDSGMHGGHIVSLYMYSGTNPRVVNNKI